MKGNILLIDDDPVLRSALSARLIREGFVVETAESAARGLEKATSLPFGVIVLDITLPDRSTLDVCCHIRQAGITTPILILSERRQTTDKVVALKLGADDYVTKPFKPAELIARLEVLLRRHCGRFGGGVHQFDSIRVAIPRSEVTRDGKLIDLSAREFQLLCYLVEREGSSVPRSELLSSVWGYDRGVLSRTVDVHVASLRNKLEDNPNDPKLILTASGIGYKFIGPKAAWLPH
jgi:two-component system, OmpR family, alkaline phosphatase synthesis response regulator PhoP